MRTDKRPRSPRKVPPLLASLMFLECTVLGSRPDGDRLARVKASANYRDGKFRNGVESPMMKGSFFGVMKEQMFGKQVRVPPKPLPADAPKAADFAEPPSELQVVWLGHSTFLLEVEGKRLLVDPVFESHASPVPITAKRFQAPPLSRDSLPRIDAILISHDHYDHLEMETMRHFADRGVPFVAPLGVGSHLEGWGVPRERIIELDWWQEHDLDGLRLVCSPAQHFSGRGAFDIKKTLWASWSVIGRVRRVHYSGDGGYGPHFQEIGERLGPFDLTLLENGAYDKRWPTMHMFPEEGVQAHLDLRGEALLPVHWGMFNLANHDWNEPIRRIAAAADAKGVRLLTPRLGQVLRPLEGPDPERWWDPLPPRPEKTPAQAPAAVRPVIPPDEESDSTVTIQRREEPSLRL